MKAKTGNLFHDLLISIISGVVVGTIVGRILKRQQIATAQNVAPYNPTVRG